MNLPHDIDSVSQVLIDLTKKNAPTQDVYFRPFVYKSSVQLSPRLQELTFRTSPRRGAVVLDGERRRTPVTVTTWVRHAFQSRAPRQRIAGARQEFRRWSDGGARKHVIVAPRRATEYTAYFRRARR